MGATLDETRLELAAQRDKVRATADRLEAAARGSLDVRGWIRRRPLRTVAFVGGIVFLLAGGPRRVVRGAGRVIRGADAEGVAYRSLPGGLRAFVDAAAPGGGEQATAARHQLARALAEWREDPRNRRRARRLADEALVPPGPARVFWRTAEVAATVSSALLVRRLVQELLADQARRPAEGRQPHTASQEQPPATPTPRYSGWSGLRSTPAGPARPSQSDQRPAPKRG